MVTPIQLQEAGFVPDDFKNLRVTEPDSTIAETIAQAFQTLFLEPHPKTTLSLAAILTVISVLGEPLGSVPASVLMAYEAWVENR